MYFNLRKYSQYIKSKIDNLNIKELKAKSFFKKKKKSFLKFSKQDIFIYLLAILEYQKKKVFFTKIFKKFKKKYKMKLLYSTFMQNINVVCVLFEYLFNLNNKEYLTNYKNNTKIGLEISILDSSLLPAIKDESRNYIRHKEDTTKQNGRLITGLKLFTKINSESKITFIKIEKIRKSDITFFKENESQIIKDEHILLTDSGFSSKAFKKKLNEKENFKIKSF